MVRAALFLVLFASVPAWAAEPLPKPEAEKPKPRDVSEVKLLYFHATWCQGCKRLDAGRVVERLQEREPKLAVEKVDVDAHKELLDQYGVEYTPTLLLVDATGFKLGKVKIDLADPDATLERAHKLVKKATGR